MLMKKQFFFQLKSYLLLFLLSLFSASAWALATPDYVCFENTGTENATIANTDGNMFLYTIDNGSTWSGLPFFGNNTVTLAAGQKMYVKAKQVQAHVNANSYYGKNFVITGSGIKVSGNIMTLLNPDATESATLSSDSQSKYNFRKLFADCTAITDASGLKLPTNTTRGCYECMFYGCTNLVSAPLTIGNSATVLQEGCCFDMFYGCTNLINAPELPATTLASKCYKNMFDGCTSLSNAPELPATTLVTDCYYYMFSGCTTLNKITVGFSDWAHTGVNNATNKWVQNVASTGTFISTNPSLDLTQTGISRVPTGWDLPNVCFEAVGEASSVKMKRVQDTELVEP